MKTAVAVDLHIHSFTAFSKQWSGCLTDRASICLDTFGLSLVTAENLGCDNYVVGGDLYHVASPSPQLQARVRRIFEGSPLDKFLMDGNHDIETYAYLDSAIAPLHQWDGNANSSGKHVGTPQVIDGMLFVPFRADAPSKWLGEVFREYQGLARVAYLHMGLSTDRTPAYMSDHQGAIKAPVLADLAMKFGFDRVIMGDWHNPDLYSPKGSTFQAHQVSTLIPATFSDSYKGVGRMAIYDSETNEVSFVTIPGPRFIKLDGPQKSLKKWEGDIASATVLHFQISCSVGEFDACVEKVKLGVAEIRGESEIPLHFVPKYDTAVAKSKARTACLAAKSASTLEGAVAMWSRSRDIRDDLRPAVLAKVAELTRKSGALVA